MQASEPKMMVFDKNAKVWHKVAFKPEFGIRGVRQTAETLRNNGIPAFAVTDRMTCVC